jgi:DEAD/DEAH box helicase domain-containing protein
VALYLDDRQEEQRGDFEAYWNGFLRLYTLFQFLPGAYPATADEEAFRGYEDLLDSSAPEPLRDHVPADGALGDFDETEWEQAFSDAEYSPDEVLPLLETIYEAELPAPSVPFELQSGGTIVGTAEIGWPEANVAVLLANQEPHRDAFEEEGWAVYPVADVEGEPERLIEALLEEA